MVKALCSVYTQDSRKYETNIACHKADGALAPSEPSVFVAIYRSSINASLSLVDDFYSAPIDFPDWDSRQTVMPEPWME